MIIKTFFTLTEYKRNYERLRNEFVDAYEDNDEEEFIFLQSEWYQKCLESAKIKRGFVGDTIGWFPKSLVDGNSVIWEVYDKIKDDNGNVDQTLAQNFSVSFSKIIKFLKHTRNDITQVSTITPGQLALYYFILHELKLEPRFKQKVKEIEELSELHKINAKNFQLKYNEISRTNGQEGYSTKDVDVVKQILITKNPSAVNYLEKITQHIY